MEADTQLPNVIDVWARRQGANVCYDSYANELAIWKAQTTTDSVDTALEVGSGAGFFAATLAAEGLAERVIGLDPITGDEGTTTDEFETTRDALEATGYTDRIEFRHGWFPDNLPDTLVDMIIFRNCLHHIYQSDESTVADVVGGLETARDHLRPGGTIYIAEPTIPPRWQQAIIRVYRQARGNGPMHWWEKRTASQWAGLVSDAGFVDVQRTRLPYNFAVGTHLERVSRLVSHKTLITGRAPDS